MTIYIHIGTQKTGSTTIQRALHAQRRELVQLGLTYPEVDAADDNKVSHYNSIRGFFSNGDEAIKQTEDFVARVNAVNGDVLISAENLSSLPPRMQEESLPDYWARKQKVLEKIRDSFDDPDIRIIFCLRDRSAYLKSLFNQYLKVRGTPSRSLDGALTQFLTTQLHTADYDGQLAILRQIFNEVRVLDFDAHKGGSLVTAFAALLDRPVKLNEPKRLNESVKWSTLELLRIRRTFGGRLWRPNPEQCRRYDESAEHFITNQIATALRRSGIEGGRPRTKVAAGTGKRKAAESPPQTTG